MAYRKLGQTGLEVSPLCLGGSVFCWTAGESASFEVLDTYLAGGGNFIDTAEVYSRWISGHTGGESEDLLGRWMQSRRCRDRVVIATKVGAPGGDAPDQQGLSRRRIMAAVDGSLKRLRTDVIDLYQAHYDDKHTPLEETLGAFNDLIKAGKIRHIGASNYTAPRLAEAFKVAGVNGLRPFETMQPLYNLLDREDYEGPLEAFCQAEGLGVITYFSLASGFLTGKYRRDRPLPASGRAESVKARYMNPRGFRVLEALDQAAERLQATPAELALAWVMARPSVTSAIASGTSGAQMTELMKALDVQFDMSALRLLDEASQSAV